MTRNGAALSQVVCDRRTFVCVAVGALAAGAGGCASVAALPVRAPGGVVRLPLDEHPALAQPGALLRIQPEGHPTALFVVHLEDGYAALSPICQHLGCTVNVQGARFVCPCHGSTYDRDGSVLRGPTERPLVRYALEMDGGVLVIRLEAA